MAKEYPMFDQNTVLAKNVRMFREERGWSVKDFSKICGYPESLINDIERGSAAVDVKGLAVLAKAFQIPAPDLIIWKDEAERILKEYNR